MKCVKVTKSLKNNSKSLNIRICSIYKFEWRIHTRYHSDQSGYHFGNYSNLLIILKIIRNIWISAVTGVIEYVVFDKISCAVRLCTGRTKSIRIIMYFIFFIYIFLNRNEIVKMLCAECCFSLLTTVWQRAQPYYFVSSVK